MGDEKLMWVACCVADFPIFGVQIYTHLFLESSGPLVLSLLGTVGTIGYASGIPDKLSFILSKLQIEEKQRGEQFGDGSVIRPSQAVAKNFTAMGSGGKNAPSFINYFNPCVSPLKCMRMLGLNPSARDENDPIVFQKYKPSAQDDDKSGEKTE